MKNHGWDHISTSNTELRKKAKSAFEKDFYKLMNNSAFGKTMENLRKRVDIKLVKTDGSENEKLRKIIAKPTFKRRVKFSDELSAIHVNKTKLTLNKPIYVGFSVIDLSKPLMYDWYYNTKKKVLRKLYPAVHRYRFITGGHQNKRRIQRHV